ncbi:MAG: patatin-like phospholipase family protein [Syntrophobacteraceae bacterium]
MSAKRFKSALVLSGGSARALSHLGVLESIERQKVQVDMIVGTSMGAVIGGLYAYYRDSSRVIARLGTLFRSEVFLKTASAVTAEGIAQVGPDGFFNRFVWLFRKGVYYTHSMLHTELVREDLYDEMIAMLVPDILIEDLPIPFASVAMDLATGDEIVITSGSLRRAIAASSAIPGLLPVIEIDGRSLVDGGWVDNVPVAPAIALGAHFVIAVDATLEISGMTVYPQSAIEIVLRTNEITRIVLNRHRKSYADVVVTPEIGQLFWADFRAMDRCMEAGRKAFDATVREVSKKHALRRCLTLGGLVHPARACEWRHPFLIS